MATITELHPTDISSGIDQARSINLYQISLNNVTIELSSLGASITKILLPNYSHPELPRDDVVLSYANPQHQDQHRNSQFFGAIVGRVANRIKGGQFQLLQTLPSGDGDVNVLETYHLDKNNGPNHLHGGIDGFCHRVWKGEIIDGNTVKFSLDSPDGDQGYPAGIHVTATYSLESLDDIVNKNGASLCLKMQAHLIPGEVKATPISLAQHSYFNLASHNSKERILKHSLKMPNCKKFTPLDSNSIPTRKLQSVESNTGKAMDFRREELLADAIMQYGREKVGLPSENIAQMTSRILSLSNSDSESVYEVARVPKDGGAAGENLAGGSPYGFDHNYVIDKNNGEASSDKRNNLQIAAILSHEETGRSLCVSTTAPGIQLYTSNYLDGTNPPPALCKEGSRYHQWQGICLETQTYPDSIHPRSSNEDVLDDEFFEGRCFILKPGGENYLHVVRYDFGGIDQHG